MLLDHRCNGAVVLRSFIDDLRLSVSNGFSASLAESYPAPGLRLGDGPLIVRSLTVLGRRMKNEREPFDLDRCRRRVVDFGVR